jgi:hypothetical protein
VTGDDYFDGLAPIWVLAPTTGDAGVTVPNDPDNPPLLSTGWTVYSGTDAGQQFSDSTPLAPGVDPGGARDVNNDPIDIPEMVPLAEAYAANNPKISAKLTSAHPETKYGWYSGPVTITFTCTDPPVGGITGSCPSPITVTKNGKKLGPWTGRVTAADNAATATVTVRAFGLDTGHAKVKVTGPANGRTYKSKVPAPHCKATESLSGVAACKLTTRKTKIAHGFKETVTATATTRAGLTSSAKLAFKVTTAAKPKNKKH